MFEQKFAFSLVGFFVHMRHFVWFFGFLLFLQVLEWIFFVNGFPNPFTVHFRPSFLLESNYISR